MRRSLTNHYSLTTNHFLVLFFSLLIIHYSFSSASAQSIVTADVDRNTLTTDDTLRLTVSVNGQPEGPPVLPPLDSFEVLGTSSSNQVTIVNGSISSNAVYFYNLRPTEVGDILIEPILAVVDGETYSTDPITVTVEQGVLPVAPSRGEIVPPTDLTGQDIYVEAEVDKPNPWQGEQVTYTARLFLGTDVRMRGETTYSAPEFVGFWKVDNEDTVSYLVNLEGRDYGVGEKRQPIFPTVAGTRKIKPASMLLANGQTYLTDEVTVNVRSLPSPSPEGFKGAVGRYRISAELVPNTPTITTGDALTWKIALGGAGNIETIPDPVWPDLENARWSETSATVTTEFQDGVVFGSRQYELLVIPTKPGQLTIPALEYIYFDPETGQYETESSDPFTIEVVGDVIDFGTEEAAEPVDESSSLRPLKSAPSRLKQKGTPLVNNPVFWMLWLVPLMIVGLAGVAHRMDSRMKIPKPKVEFMADRGLSPEQRVSRYLSDNFDIPESGMTQSQRASGLREEGVSEETIEAVKGFFDSAEMTRYAPVNDANNLNKQAKAVIDLLKKEL